jgi:hypothetical protein
MITANNSSIDSRDWLYELGGMPLPEAQALLSFALRATWDQDNVRSVISNRLSLFPSIQDLKELFGEAMDVLDILASTLEPLVSNLREECADDPVLIEAVMRTGIPVQILRRCLLALRGDYDLRGKDLQARLLWADRVVHDALVECEARAWYKELFVENKIDLPSMFSSITLWRSGTPLAEIEQNWQLKKSVSLNQIGIGEFFNHKISMVAQFWGALSICEEVSFPDARSRPLENFQTYVREGISSVTELEWLNRIGGVDRVLAHTLAEVTPDDMGKQELKSYIGRQMERWQESRHAIPLEIQGEKLGALVSILNERRE